MSSRRTQRWKKAWGLAALAAGALPAGAAGVVGNGTPASCTEATLNAALTGGGTVTFNCGPNPVTIPITSQKTISSPTTVVGGGLITLHGGDATRIFFVNYQRSLAVHGLTFRNARVSDVGAAIRTMTQTSVTITDSAFYDNLCTQAGPDIGGGALYLQGADVLIRNSVFARNRGANGGAIGNLQSRLTIEDSSFTQNGTHAGGGGGHGGAIYVDGANAGSVVIRRSTFDDNSAGGFGGAIHSYMYAGASRLVVENSRFANNQAQGNAGAIYHQNAGLEISGSTFVGNQTPRQGGALWLLQNWSGGITNSTFAYNRANGVPPNNGSTGLGGAMVLNADNYLTLSHLTIAHNFADWVGGGICGGGTATLRGSIVAHNSAANGGNPWNIGHSCCTQLQDGGRNIQLPAKHPTDPNDSNCAAGVVIADPLLQPLASNGGPTQTMALSLRSPAADFVSAGCPPPTVDQRGQPRPAGAACDAGAHEGVVLPSLSVADASVTEGDGGTTWLQFTVSASMPVTQAASAAFATSDLTATAGADYTAAAGSVQIAAGASSATLQVQVLGDLLDELDETLLVTLSAPVNATLGDAQAVGTILDDDPQPSLSAGDVSLVEGHAGSQMADVTVTLSAPSGLPVSVAYATQAGSAVAPSDFAAIGGSLAFAPGVTQRTARVAVHGDTAYEPDESFGLVLSAPQNAVLADPTGVVTIANDDAAGLSVSDLHVAEGPAGTTQARFRVTLAPAAAGTVAVDYATVDGTAQAGSDYLAAAGTLVFAPGQSQLDVPVTVLGDVEREPDQTFQLQLSNPSGAPLADASGVATIVDRRLPDWNADGRPDLVFANALSGRLVVWFMDGTVRQSAAFTAPDGWPDLTWQVAGSGDFDLDGHTDLLWRNQASGELRLWLMDGVTRIAELTPLPGGIADSNWSVRATGDFDGDGRVDLVWRNAVSGNMVVWLMDGALRRSGAFTVPASVGDLNWKLVGTGDLNADNKTDLLWRHALSGRLVYWWLDGLQRITGGFLNPATVGDPNWSAQALVDLNGDAQPDVLWRHALSGKMVVWLMNGVDRASGTYTTPDGVADLNWSVAAPR